MQKQEYTCERCDNTYEKIDSDEWNDEMAANEFKRNFPNLVSPKISIICDDCYNELIANRK